ncbi:hypothetical protein CHU95_17875 [Niveispirillum lacus]|uniref:Uncharacterized protein n=1 Tax=Niveispirillum lacus TaxID=1981099 RepID=A0A255YTV6_9PROT|nr:hypothetical protein [Niveispirillum lacus]OYQ32642.1 hypothetical protein CHU95_17875 [Niveispirillum lacus]
MHDRLQRPTAAKAPAAFMRTKESKPSGGFDGLPAGLRMLDDAKENVGLAEILAALTAEPAQPNMRLREVEDSIRRHWAVLRNLVREHAELTRAAMDTADASRALHGDRPLPRVAMFTPPSRGIVAAE